MAENHEMLMESTLALRTDDDERQEGGERREHEEHEEIRQPRDPTLWGEN